MKRANLAIVTVFGLGALGLASLAAYPDKIEATSKIVSLKISSDRTNYKLGEVVKLSIELKNESENNLVIHDVFGVGDGSVRVFISSDGKTYPEYSPGWGQMDFASTNTIIKPNESIVSSADVLWHSKPNAIKGESDAVVKEVAKKTLLTDYAFPEAGIYFIKATYTYNESLESEPIQITMTEPVGEDLEVWNKIKNRGEFAFFIQNDYFQIDYKPEERAKFQKEIENILIDHPTSLYAESLRQSLEKFRASEAKRQDFLRNLQKQKPQ